MFTLTFFLLFVGGFIVGEAVVSVVYYWRKERLSVPMLMRFVRTALGLSLMFVAVNMVEPSEASLVLLLVVLFLFTLACGYLLGRLQTTTFL